MGGKRFHLVARLVVSIIVLCQVVVPSLALTLNAPGHIYECEFATFSWDGGSSPYSLTYAVGAGGVGDANGIGGEQNCASTDDTSVNCYIPRFNGKSLRFTLTDGSNESATAWLVVESNGACDSATATSTAAPTTATSPPTSPPPSSPPQTPTGDSFPSDTGTATTATATTVKPTGDADTSTSAGSPPAPPNGPSANGLPTGSSGSAIPNSPSTTSRGNTNPTVSTAPNGSVTTIVNGGGNANGNGNGDADGGTHPTAVPIAGNTAEDEDQVRISKKVIPAIVGTILGAFVCLFAFLCFRWKRRQWKKRRPVPVLPVDDAAHEDVPASATSSGNSAQFSPRPLNLITEMSSAGGHTLAPRSPLSPTSPLTSHRYLTQSQIRSQSHQSHSQSQFQLSPPSLHIPPPPPLPPFAPRYHTLPDSKQRSPNRSPSTPTAAGNIGRTGAFPPASTAHSDDSHSMGGTGSEYPGSSVQPPYTMGSEEGEEEEQRPPYDGYTSYYGGETGVQGIDTHPNDYYDRQPYPYHFDLSPTSSTPFTTSIGTTQTGPSMSGGSNQPPAPLQVIVQKELDTLMRSGDARIHQDRRVPITYPGEQNTTSPISPRTQQVPRLQVVNYDEEEESSQPIHASTSKKALSAYSSPPVRASNRGDSPAYSATDPTDQSQQAAVGIRRRDMEALADLVAARITRENSATSPPATNYAPGPPPSYA